MGSGNYGEDCGVAASFELFATATQQRDLTQHEAYE